MTFASASERLRRAPTIVAVARRRIGADHRRDAEIAVAVLLARFEFERRQARRAALGVAVDVSFDRDVVEHLQLGLAPQARDFLEARRAHLVAEDEIVAVDVVRELFGAADPSRGLLRARIHGAERQTGRAERAEPTEPHSPHLLILGHHASLTLRKGGNGARSSARMVNAS